MENTAVEGILKNHHVYFHYINKHHRYQKCRKIIQNVRNVKEISENARECLTISGKMPKVLGNDLFCVANTNKNKNVEKSQTQIYQHNNTKKINEINH